MGVNIPHGTPLGSIPITVDVSGIQMLVVNSTISLVLGCPWKIVTR